MSEFEISELSFGSGIIGMSPLPGAKGDYATEMAAWLQWKPDAVLSIIGQAEMKKLGSADIPDDLRNANIQWLHFPVDDFQAAPADRDVLWVPVSQTLHRILNAGGRVIVHCRGGCGRTGMSVLRLMVEAGEEGESAMKRLRAVRPCAVETSRQKDWALRGQR
jgi:protein-tyrosine phosphatase